MTDHSGWRVGQASHELKVHPLVDHPVEAEARMRQACLIDRVVHRRLVARLAEMSAVHAGGEGVDVGVPAALGLVQAVAAGEDDVGEANQLFFQGTDALRRELEVGKLVHAVVDHCRGVFGHGTRKLQHHGRVVPGDRPLDLTFRDHRVQQRGQRFAGGLRFHPSRQPRRGHDDAGLLVGDRVQRDTLAPVGGKGLLENEHPSGLGKSRHEVLRTLEYEVPAKVGEADDRVAAAMAERRGRDDGSRSRASCRR